MNFTTTESPADMAEAGKRYGVDFSIETVSQGLATEEEAAAAATAEAEKPKADEVPSSEEKKPKVEGDEPAAVEKPVEAAPEGEEELAEAPDKIKRILKEKNQRIDKLTSRWKTEKTNRETIESEVESLKAEVAALKAGKPKTEAQPEPVDNAPKRPTRPPRPKLEQFEFDQSRYDAAMDEYEEKAIPAYEDALSAYTRAEAVREMQAAREAEDQAEIVRQNNEAWQEALDSREGFRDKLAAATDINRSPAMATVMDSLFEPAERIEILDYLIDNPDEAERILQETLGPEGKGKTSAQQWAYLTSVATKEFAAILKDSKASAKGKPGPVEVPPKPKSQSAPPAKPKPPVSAAPAPIEPVGGRAGATTVRLDDPNIDHDSYRKAREQDVAARRKAGFR